MEPMTKKRRLCPASQEARGDDCKILDVCYSAVRAHAHTTETEDNDGGLPETLPGDISCKITDHLQKHRYEATLKAFLELDMNPGEVQEQLNDATSWSEKADILLMWANHPSNGCCCDLDDEALVAF